MIYITADVLVFAFLDNGEYGKHARELMKALDEQKFQAGTSILTFDRVMENIKKLGDKESMTEAGKNMLAMGISFFPVTKKTLQESINTIQHPNINPRNAIHLATMKENNITVIISEDKAFDNLKGITRHPIRLANIRLKKR